MKNIIFILIVLLLCISLFAEDFSNVSSYGSGYVVWESNRTGNWRIFYNTLDGKGERQISKEDGKDRNHTSAHASPSGDRVVYINIPVSDKDTKAYDLKGSLRMIDMKTMTDTVLFDEAYDYGGGRSAVWIDNDNMIYIAKGRITSLYNFKTKKSAPLYDNTSNNYNLLMDATLKFAVPEYPAYIYNYKKSEQKMELIEKLSGCMPYPTTDGKWIVWMGGAGGPVSAFDPLSGVKRDIFQKNDIRLPNDRSYIYFPEVSWNMKAIAFAASPNQHDHDTSDYDIFVSRLNGKSLDGIGNPVRYSFDKHTDRFPSVYFEDFELGSFLSEGKSIINVDTKSNKAYDWDFGDGTKIQAGGAKEKHTYIKPGTYVVSAVNNGNIKKGTVTIAVPRKPIAKSAVIDNKINIKLFFDEEINIKDAKLALHSGVKIKTVSLSSDKKTILLKLEKELVKKDKLYVKGITDLAQVPNLMDPASFEIDIPRYPIDTASSIASWVAGGVLESDVSAVLDLSGRCFYDNNNSLCFIDGMVNIGDRALSDLLLKRLKATNEITLELDFSSYNIKQSGPSRILSFSNGTRDTNFTIGQENEQILLRLKTDSNKDYYTFNICNIESNENIHLVCTYKNGVTSFYVNDKKIFQGDAAGDGFSSWADLNFKLGNENGASRPFNGKINGFAVYDRAFSEKEAIASYYGFKDSLKLKENKKYYFEAKLLGVSKVPNLSEIKPYREALITLEYEVLNSKKNIRVVNWAILDGEIIPLNEIGKTYKLVLEDLNANPQLDSFYMSDTLDLNADIPMFYEYSQFIK